MNAKAMEGSHTSEYLAVTLMAMVEWKISKESGFMILSDSGANIAINFENAKE